MDVDQYIEIYHRTDLSGLNDAVGALEGRHKIDVLRELERRGFDVAWHRTDGRRGDGHDRDSGRGAAGIVLAGPAG